MIHFSYMWSNWKVVTGSWKKQMEETSKFLRTVKKISFFKTSQNRKMKNKYTFYFICYILISYKKNSSMQIIGWHFGSSFSNIQYYSDNFHLINTWLKSFLLSNEKKFHLWKIMHLVDWKKDSKKSSLEAVLLAEI